MPLSWKENLETRSQSYIYAVKITDIDTDVIGFAHSNLPTSEICTSSLCISIFFRSTISILVNQQVVQHTSQPTSGSHLQRANKSHNSFQPLEQYRLFCAKLKRIFLITNKSFFNRISIPFSWESWWQFARKLYILYTEPEHISRIKTLITLFHGIIYIDF
jgi:hypothetical protein